MDSRRFAQDDPRAFLAELPDGAVIDEVQRAPDLLSYLQAVIDEDPAPGRWVLTGSQNFALLNSVSQSLAGRTAVHHLLPLAHNEALRFPQHPATLEDTLLTGGYPRILDRALAPNARGWIRTLQPMSNATSAASPTSATSRPSSASWSFAPAAPRSC